MGEHNRRLTGRRILVVEDEYFIADDLVRMLQSEGAEIVGPLSDVREGARVAGVEAVDAAVLDVNLHGQMVFPVADALSLRRVPFIFSTGYAEETIPTAYKEIPRFEKPYDVRALGRALADLVSGADGPATDLITSA